MKNEIWTWDWVGGGYNSCMARSREEAIRKAREIGKPTSGGMSVTLVPNLHSLRQVSSQEMSAIDRSWASACD